MEPIVHKSTAVEKPKMPDTRTKGAKGGVDEPVFAVPVKRGTDISIPQAAILANCNSADLPNVPVPESAYHRDNPVTPYERAIAKKTGAPLAEEK